MKITPTALPGVLLIDPDVHGDARGFFLETYQQARYAEIGIEAAFVQDNHSRSGRGVLRGLHMQLSNPQGKLVRATSGAVYDVAVDVDPRSPTFKRWVGTELSDSNHRQLYIPPGYAHGFCVLSERADFEYKCTTYYNPGDELGIAWDDPQIGIDWPITQPSLSERDRNNPTLAAFVARSHEQV